LQGTVSGVNVTSTSGAPGAKLDIRIRVLLQTRKPTIIDGYVGELGLLNPNDIETITVLKDAQAAIYGTIGANGVILITKTGKRIQSQESVSFLYRFSGNNKVAWLLNATDMHYCSMKVMQTEVIQFLSLM
jgi:TonB-dependent SusC/RagA subfamily outer membrane receptor